MEGLTKDTVVTSWLAKYDAIMKEEENRRPGQRPTTAMLGNEVLNKEQLYDLFQQILGVKKFEHQLLFNAMQLESSDEQAAAIRRELDARQEKLQEMQRVSKQTNKQISVIELAVTRSPIFAEQEIDAEVRVEGDGVALYRGNDAANQHVKGQLGEFAGATQRLEIRLQVQVRQTRTVSFTLCCSFFILSSHVSRSKATRDKKTFLHFFFISFSRGEKSFFY